MFSFFVFCFGIFLSPVRWNIKPLRRKRKPNRFRLRVEVAHACRDIHICVYIYLYIYIYIYIYACDLRRRSGGQGERHPPCGVVWGLGWGRDQIRTKCVGIILLGGGVWRLGPTLQFAHRLMCRFPRSVLIDLSLHLVLFHSVASSRMACCLFAWCCIML